MRYRLASLLRCRVADLEQSMGYPEYLGWMALYELEPWDPWLHAALIATVVANTHSTRRYRLTDFLPRGWRVRAQTVQEAIAALDALVKAYGDAHRNVQRGPDREHNPV